MKKEENPRVGGQYMNIHTATKCTVTDKIFFNIVYLNDDGNKQKVANPQYCHYKTFQKHWVKVKETLEG